MLSLDKIYHASYVLKGVARKTDVLHAPKINPEANVYLKTENLQNTGSFKLRGAYYKISQLSEEEKKTLNQYMAEAYALRGYAELILVNVFGHQVKVNGNDFSSTPGLSTEKKTRKIPKQDLHTGTYLNSI